MAACEPLAAFQFRRYQGVWMFGLEDSGPLLSYTVFDSGCLSSLARILIWSIVVQTLYCTLCVRRPMFALGRLRVLIAEPIYALPRGGASA